MTMLIFGSRKPPFLLGPGLHMVERRRAHRREAKDASPADERLFQLCRPVQAAGPGLRALSEACSAAVVSRCEAGQSEHAGHDGTFLTYDEAVAAARDCVFRR
jgi:hypothetical protein